MNVKLIAYTPNALQVAFAAIRTCYSNKNFEDIWNVEFEKYQEKNNDHIRLVKHIVGHGHTSTLEHISFTFSIEGISRACLAQITRHRMASYSVRSQRYVKGIQWADVGNPIPYDESEESEFSIPYFLQYVEKFYNNLLTNGVKAEDARMILPNYAATNMVMTVNLRSFINVYKVRRLGTGAQREIGELVEQMKNEIIAAEPWVEELLND